MYCSWHSPAAAGERCSIVLGVGCGLWTLCDPSLQVLYLITQVLDPLVTIDHHVIQVLDGFFQVREQRLQLADAFVDLLAGNRRF